MPPVYNYAAAAPAPGLVSSPPAMDYAQWGTRALGYLVDMLFVGVIGAALLVVAGLVFGGAVGLGSGIHPDVGQAFGQVGCCLIFSVFPIATLLVGLYNKVYLVARRGASIGQGVVHVRVVDAYGRLLSTGTAAIRLLAQVGISFVPFGGFVDLLWPLWDPQRQTLHDKAVGCYVINDRGA